MVKTDITFQQGIEAISNLLDRLYVNVVDLPEVFREDFLNFTQSEVVHNREYQEWFNKIYRYQGLDYDVQWVTAPHLKALHEESTRKAFEGLEQIIAKIKEHQKP